MCFVAREFLFNTQAKAGDRKPKRFGNAADDRDALLSSGVVIFNWPYLSS
jgi:hypothetical protein